jgi:hypothetical protein
MSENLTPVEPMELLEEKPRKRKVSIWLVVAGLLILLVIALNAIGFRPFLNVGTYNIEDVVLSSNLKDGKPIDVRTVFKPSDAIICTVTTSGMDGGIVGMRWYAGDTMIYEMNVKTQNHTAGTYIQSNKDSILREGSYHVDILVANSVIETVNFEVKVYHPTISPAIAVPSGHKPIDIPWFVEAPFVFDETWQIDGTDWNINEVKVILIDDAQEYFVTVVVNTDMTDLASIDEAGAKARARPVGVYALRNGYVDKARSLKIDGKSYPLDESLFVDLINPSGIGSFRVQFMMDELK